MSDFCHLHVHTTYSILDGINECGALAKHVHDTGMSCCAISDHGVMHGVVDFYQACQKNEVKPLLGVEAYITEDEDGIDDNKYKTKDNYHCILIAENETGLKNLFWLTNQANMHNFYYRPRISLKHFENGRADGIIATSSCLGGVVAKKGLFNKGDKTFKDEANGKTSLEDGQALRRLMKLSEIFQGRFYAEIQDNPEFWEQVAYNKWLIEASRQNNIPTVITADAHWLTKQDKATHNIIMAQQLGMSIEEYIAQGDEDGMHYGDGHYIRSPDEMLQAAIKLGAEEAFYNTMEIANRCNVDMQLGEYQSPEFNPKEEADYDDFKEWRASAFECETVVSYK